MPLDVDALATEVAHTINVALTPVLERLAAAETRLAILGDLRDRVVTMEAKSAIVVPPSIDLSPLISELRERLVAIETKAAIPLPERPDPVDLMPIVERIVATETRLEAISDLRDQVITLEAKTLAPVHVPDPGPPVDVGPLVARLDAHDRRLSVVETLTGDLGQVRERLVAVEVRAQVPGPAGKDGTPGTNGIDGKDGQPGADGVGFDDLTVDQDGERGVVLKFSRGLQVKEFPLTFPIPMYRGVYVEGRAYTVGDVVTWAGSSWHCHKATATKPDEGSTAAGWRLMVKRGNEGKPGRDGRDVVPPPVVTARSSHGAG